MATLKLSVLKARQNQQGKFPLFISITHNRNVRYIKTDYVIDDLYQFDNGVIVCRKDAKVLTQRLKYTLSEYQSKLDNIENQDIYNCTQIKEILEGKQKTDQEITFNEYMSLRIERLRKEGRNNYADMNAYTLKRINKILGVITLKSITPTSIETFIKGINKLSNASKQMQLSHFKACINEAIKERLVKYEIHPFTYVKMPKSEIRQIDITLEDFIKIKTLETKHKKISLAKDCFLLSFYLCGMNLIDIVNSDFSGDKIKFARTKTAHTKQGDADISFSIPQEAKEIIKKYIKRNGKIDFGYNFTYSNFQCYLNKCIKSMGKHLDINANICFYTARKTFAQFASEIGIPDSIIDYCLGHSTQRKGVLSYYTRVKEKQADLAIRRVIDYTNKPEEFKDFIEFKNNIMMMQYNQCL